MTIAVDLGRKATKQTNKKKLFNPVNILKRGHHWHARVTPFATVTMTEKLLFMALS